jgi:formate hydrogenlyase subunit 3/multisubunit Na+/H+ antiporter MnhD subunit
MSKLTVYLALAKAGLWWAVAIAIAASVLTMVVLVRAAYAVFWGSPKGAAIAQLQVREVPVVMWVPMVILAGACVVLGIFPQVPFPLLDKAAAVLATVGR